jgi:flagellar biosynthesis anti-sigma factor FlgM
MLMKIDGNNLFINQDYGVHKEDSAQRQERLQVEERSNPDRLELSVTGRELQNITQKTEVPVPVRTERVAEIKQQLAAGTYNIKAEEVAEAVITGSLVNEIV